MSKQANYKLIGAFVVGALGLLVGAVVIFGSGSLFQDNVRAVLFFDESVKGLQVGAPVSYRGVSIGVVKSIRILVAMNSEQPLIPVEIELEQAGAERVGNPPGTEFGRAERIEFFGRAIQRGLRARLAVDSLVTGQLYILVDFFPDTPAKFVGMEKAELEIPTMQSGMEELRERVTKIPIDEIAARANSALQSIDKLVASPEVMDSVRDFDALMKDARVLVNNIDREVMPLSGEMRKNLKQLTETSTATLDRATKVLSAAEALMAKDSPLYYRVNDALTELSAAARSLHLFADYLERHPEALLHGKSDSKGK